MKHEKPSLAGVNMIQYVVPLTKDRLFYGHKPSEIKMGEHSEFTGNQLTVSSLLPLHDELTQTISRIVSCKLTENSQRAHSVSSSCEFPMSQNSVLKMSLP